MWPERRKFRKQIHPDVLETFIRMKRSNESSAADQKYFHIWEAQHPELLKEYQELEELWEDLGLFTGEMSENEISEYMNGSFNRTQPFRRLMKKPVFATATLIVIAITGIILFSGEPAIQYQTERGERLVVSLEDGSNVHLNSQTSVRIIYDEKQRIIQLNKGEALFAVAHDENRKFMVQTANGSIQAVGTEFNVSVISDDIEITIIKGTVLVRSNVNHHVSRSSEVAVVGEQVLIDSRGMIESTTTEDADQVIAWTRGKLIFSGEPLYMAVEKINLHSKHNITVKDSRLRRLPLYGVFNTGDTLGFISAIQEAFPVKPVAVSEDATLLIYRTDG